MDIPTDHPAPGAITEWRDGFRDILPLAFGVAIYGAAFGLLAVQAQFDSLLTGLMGMVVFAGSSQMIAAERLVAGTGAVAAITAGLALNLRILLMTASLREELSGRPFWQIMLGVHFTTDESWALMHAARAKGAEVGYWYLLGGGMCIMLMWVMSTVAGTLLAHSLPDPYSIGMDFAFTAAFIAVLANLWRGKGDLWPWLAAISFTILLITFTGIEPSWVLALGGIAGATIAGVLNHD